MSSLSKNIKDTFELASLRHQAAQNLNAEQWKKFQKIKEHYDGLRRFLQRAYELEYSFRVGKERRRLINKAGSKRRNLVNRWFVRDDFDAEAINREAERQVRRSHQNDLMCLDNMEAREVANLLEASDQNRILREKPLRAFRESTDRRSGQDRRVRKHS